jgi:hypothetical protein
MKNFNHFKAVLLCLFLSTVMHAQVGIGTASPNASAALDVSASNGGMLVPRVALTGIADTTTIAAPATSLLVYNSGFAPNGYYYWSGSSWIQLTTGNADWSLTGNLGTTAGTNFIGTTDGQDIRFKTFSTDRLNISHANSGQLQSYNLGNTALPAYSFNGQTGTGMFGAATDNLGFSTAGTERVRIDNTGNVGIGTIPTASSILDMSTITNKAMEVPNVALTATTTATISSPATGALIFNTATAGTGLTAVYPGYYYWNGSAWMSMTTGGQSSTSYFTTAGVNIASGTALGYLPGFPVSVTVPANCSVFISCDIGISTNSNTTSGFSVTDIAFAIDGALTADAGYQRIYTTNNTGIGFNTKYASLSQTVTLTAGTHQIAILGGGAGLGGSSALVGGDSSSVYQGELTVTFIKR